MLLSSRMQRYRLCLAQTSFPKLRCSSLDYTTSTTEGGDYLMRANPAHPQKLTPTVLQLLETARHQRNAAQRVPGFTRGHSLCLTKVQEAIFWLNQDNSYVVGT